MEIKTYNGLTHDECMQEIERKQAELLKVKKQFETMDKELKHFTATVKQIFG